MHFYKERGKTHLSLKGEVLLTRGDPNVPVTYGTKSAMPHSVTGGHRIVVRGFWGRVKATINVLWYIWAEK